MKISTKLRAALAALVVLENNKPKYSMKIIVPMAGRGSRLRPHTLTVPKPLIPIAGKPIVQRLVEDIVSVCGDKKVDEIAFIIGDFGDQVEVDLKMLQRTWVLRAAFTIKINHWERRTPFTVQQIVWTMRLS